MTNSRNAHLWFAGTEPRAVSLIAPIDTTAARGSAGHGEFVMEHRKGGDSLVILLTLETEEGAGRFAPVSVAIPAALVRDLINQTAEFSYTGRAEAQA